MEPFVVAPAVLWRRCGDLARLTRWTNSLYAGVYTLAGAYLAAGPAAVLRGDAWLAAMVVGLIVAVGFVLNDIVDHQVDRYAKPERPIPSGKINRRQAFGFAVGLVLPALIGAAALGPDFLAVAVFTIGLATIYSLRLKGTILWGNAAMASLIATIVVFGAMTTGRLPLQVWIVAGLMWLFDFSHEILKTSADHTGDGLAGVTTVATALGLPAAIRIFRIASGLYLATALLPWLLGLAPALYAWTILACSVIPFVVVMIRLSRNHTDATISSSLRILRYLWIANLLPIIVLGAGM
jgi:geranylgeranylglycerol-phosphate geranylgeranyltransferase